MNGLSGNANLLSFNSDSSSDDDFEVSRSPDISLIGMKSGNSDNSNVSTSVSTMEAQDDLAVNSTVTAVQNTVDSCTTANEISYPEQVAREDPISIFGSILTDYQAAQQANLRENELLREVYKIKNREIEKLRHDLEMQKLEYELKLRKIELALTGYKEASSDGMKNEELDALLREIDERVRNVDNEELTEEVIAERKAFGAAMSQKLEGIRSYFEAQRAMYWQKLVDVELAINKCNQGLAICSCCIM